MLHPPRRRGLLGALTAGLLVAAGLAALPLAPASAAGETPLGFAVYPAPGQLARDAGEPTIGVNWKTGKVMFQAFTETDQVTFDDSKVPATASWKDVSRAPTNVTSLDPVLETDSTIGRTFVSQLAPPCSVAAYTDSDGEPTATNPNGYTPFVGCGVGSNFDHQTVGTGPTINTQLDAVNRGRLVYYCSQVVAQSSCSVSRDGGTTFATSRPVYTFKGDLVSDPLLVGCEGLHGHLNTSPLDGTAYLPNFACNSSAERATNRPSVIVSPDEGLTWTVRQVPDGTSPNFDSDPAVDADEAGTAYVAYENATSNMMVAVTRDKGQTFTPSLDLGAAIGGLQNATMPTVVAGSAGRAAVGFLATRAEAPIDAAGQPENQLLSFDPDGNDPAAGWHAYIALTYDGGATWTTTDVTPTDPVQRGCIWWGSARNPGTATTCEDNKRNLLDFIDISVDQQGRVVLGFADGCVGRCVTEGHTRNTNLAYADRPAADAGLTEAQFAELYSQEDIGTIVRQQSGKGLYAAADALPSGPLLGGTTPQVVASASASVSPAATPSPSPSGSPAATSAPSSAPPPGGGPAPSCSTATGPVTLSPASIRSGSTSVVRVSGPVGSVVDLVAYTRPSTTYRTVRTATIGTGGTADLTVRPGSNTRLYAQQRGCPAGPSSVLTVVSTLSLDQRRTGTRTLRFFGNSLPKRAGGLSLRLYRVDAAGREVLTGRTTTDPRTGTWTITRTFTGTGRFGFLVRTGADITNAAGASAVRQVTVR